MTNKGPFQIKSSRNVYRNHWLELREDEVIRPDGSPGIFGVIDMKAGSSVVAVDRDFRIVLGKEFKYGINRESIEILSGAIEDGETPIDCAHRELKEETGFSAGTWVDLGMIDPFTTVVHSPNYIFLAMDLLEGARSLDAGEIIEIVKIPLEEAARMVMDSRITHGASCIAILKVDRYLRQQKHLL